MNAQNQLYHETEGIPTFHLGDKVKVVDVPFSDCKFSWVADMNRFCGLETVIKGCRWSNYHGCYCYSIDADNRLYSWCANCFEEVQADLEESDSDMSILLP